MEVFTTDKRTCERSKTVIVVKNIPYNVTEREIEELFGRYGVVYKVASTA